MLYVLTRYSLSDVAQIQQWKFFRRIDWHQFVSNSRFAFGSGIHTCSVLSSIHAYTYFALFSATYYISRMLSPIVVSYMYIFLSLSLFLNIRVVVSEK